MAMSVVSGGIVEELLIILLALDVVEKEQAQVSSPSSPSTRYDTARLTTVASTV